MAKILICTHGRFGEELIKSAEMIGGKLKNIEAVSLLPEMSPEDYCDLLKKYLALEELNICFVDLFGGTPCNVILKLSVDYNIEVLCGVNLPMILESLTMDPDVDIESYKTHLLKTYSEGGFDVSLRLKSVREINYGN